MRRFIPSLTAAVVAVVVALLMSACSIGGDGPSLSKEWADEVWPADTQAERAVRACMATAVVAELGTYRVLWEGGTPEERAALKGGLMSMKVSVAEVRAKGEDDPWFETSMFYVLNSLLRHVAPIAKERILGGVRDALTGNIGGLLSEVKTSVGQGALTDAMLRDVAVVFEAEDPDIEAAWNACEQRIDLNIERL